VYWFNPLAWIAWRQLSILAERACDDAVIARTDGTDYAEQLVTLARRLSNAPRPMLSMAGRSALSIRVGAILNPQQRRGRAGAAASACIIGSATVLAGTVASVEATALGHVRHGSVPTLAVTTGDARNALPAGTGPVTSKLEAEGDPKPVDRQRSRGTAVSQQPTVRQAPREPQSPAPVPPAANSSAPTTYVIGVGDVLYISVLRQQELSSEVVVRPDGKISLPLLGDVHAAGLPPDQLRDVVTTALAKFVIGPVVTVQVRAASARVSAHNVFVIGEVARPGMYPLSDSMTVLQLLATAGGLSKFARRDGVVIVRQVDGKSITLPFDYAAVTAGQRLEQNVMLLPGDVVTVR
jgi:polysaccharide export outer membrane protein